MIRRRSALLAALLLLPGAGGVRAAEPAKDKPPKDPPGLVRMSDEQQHTVQLQSVRVDRRPITEPVRVPGVIAFDQGHVAILRPLAQARVLRLLVQPGDPVRAGQALAELDIPSLSDAQGNLAAAQASRHEAEAGVSVARDTWRRGELLARDGSLARAEAERRRLLLEQAQAALDSARARALALETTVARLEPSGPSGHARLSSPIAGVVVSVDATSGGLIETGGAGAITIADLSVVVALAQVPEASVPLLAVGDPADVRLTAGGDRHWSGRVVALGAELNPQARTLAARAALSNPDGALRAGMAVDMTLTSDRGRDDLVVPASAVQTVGDKRVAFIPLGDGRFQGHDLQLGVERSDWIEIRDGLHAGDTVVTKGSFELKALLQKAMLGDAG